MPRTPTDAPSDPATTAYFAFRGRDLIVVEDGPNTRVPMVADWQTGRSIIVRENDLGNVAGVRTIAGEVRDEGALPDGFVALGLRRLWGRLSERDLKIASRAVQIVEWDRSHQFCGRCGGPTEKVAGEFSRRCPRCDFGVYPRLSPAVIVLVERQDAVLLGRSLRFPGEMYSTLAGFVEAGETLEETVIREIREEAAVDVRNVKYFGSQPWPFPDSLMLAFVAEYAGGTPTPQPTELADVRWFSADAMPVVPPRWSIARALIDAWMQRQGHSGDELRSMR